jgi:hypothetical protein
MRHRGVPVSAAGIVELYEGLIDGLVTDEQLTTSLPIRRADLLMDGAPGRERLARESLDFALSLP